MAAALTMTTESYDVTNCTKCHQLLQSPRNLPCLHSYCENCLDKHAEAESTPKGKVKCVECGEVFDIPTGGLKEWHSLAIVHRLTEQKALQKRLGSQESISCTACVWIGKEEKQRSECDVTPAAVARCSSCNDYLCKRCFAIHKSQRLMKDHPVFTLDELRKWKVPDYITAEKNMCLSHEGEALLFYCETCDVPICRQCVVVAHRHPEHKQVEMKQTAKERVQRLKQMQESCGKNDKEVDKALQEIRKTRRDFDLAVSEARIQIKDTVKKLKSSYLKRLDEAQKAIEDELNTIEKEGLDIIKTSDNQLTSITSRISTAKTLVNLLTESGTEYEVASDYGNLKAVLEDVVAKEPSSIIDASQNLTDVKFEENTDRKSDEVVVIGRVRSRSSRPVRDLKNKTSSVLKMEFGNTGNEKLSCAFDVALLPTGNIAVTDHSVAKVNIFNVDGSLKSTFKVNVGVDAGRSCQPLCIEVGPDNLLYITDYSSPYVKIFDFQGTYQRYFHTISAEGVVYNTQGSSWLAGLTFNAKDQVLVGNRTHKFISFHSTDGKHQKSIKVPLCPFFLAVTSKGNILVSPHSIGDVHVINEAGHLLYKLQKPSGASSWYPEGITISKCFQTDDDEDEVFVGDNANGRAVYRYSVSGKYIDCVTKGLSQSVFGITLSADEKELFVANRYTVKCFEI